MTVFVIVIVIAIFSAGCTALIPRMLDTLRHPNFELDPAPPPPPTHQPRTPILDDTPIFELVNLPTATPPTIHHQPKTRVSSGPMEMEIGETVRLPGAVCRLTGQVAATCTCPKHAHST